MRCHCCNVIIVIVEAAIRCHHCSDPSGLCQILSGDSWASSITRGIFQGEKTEPDVALFFVSYVLIASIMLLNVVCLYSVPMVANANTRFAVEQLTHICFLSMAFDLEFQPCILDLSTRWSFPL